MSETTDDVEPYVPDDDDLNQLIEYHNDKRIEHEKIAVQHSNMAETYKAILATPEDQRAPFEDEALTELIRVQDEELARVEAAMASRRGWVDRMKGRLGLPTGAGAGILFPGLAQAGSNVEFQRSVESAGNPSDVPPPPPPWDSTPDHIQFRREVD